MNDIITAIVVAILGSNALVEFIRFLVERHDRKKDSPEKIALRALCEDRLGILLRDWLHNDIRLADDWRIIDNLYSGYTALDGNGEIKKLYLEASEVHITE